MFCILYSVFCDSEQVVCKSIAQNNQNEKMKLDEETKSRQTLKSDKNMNSSIKINSLSNSPPLSNSRNDIVSPPRNVNTFHTSLSNISPSSPSFSTSPSSSSSSPPISFSSSSSIPNHSSTPATTPTPTPTQKEVEESSDRENYNSFTNGEILDPQILVSNFLICQSLPFRKKNNVFNFGVENKSEEEKNTEMSGKLEREFICINDALLLAVDCLQFCLTKHENSAKMVNDLNGFNSVEFSSSISTTSISTSFTSLSLVNAGGERDKEGSIVSYKNHQLNNNNNSDNNKSNYVTDGDKIATKNTGNLPHALLISAGLAVISSCALLLGREMRPYLMQV